MPVRLSASLVAEFVGAFALCFIGIMAIAQAGNGGAALIAVALAHGIILAIAVTATMPTSGGHLNPAVTFSFLITGKIKPGAAMGYIIAQLLGGLAAGAAAWVISGGNAEAAAVVLNGTPHLNGLSPMIGCFAEAIATFLLVFAIWGTAADPRAKQVGGFAIGLHHRRRHPRDRPPDRRAAMNPSRVLGPAIIAPPWPRTGADVWNGHWIYWVGTFVGAPASPPCCITRSSGRHRQAPGREAKAVDVPPMQRP